MAKVAINGDVLSWALADSGRDARDLAEAASRPVDTVKAWIDGVDSPHWRDLRTAASLLGRSPLFFCLPERPQIERASVRYRRFIKENATAEERAREIAAVRWAKRQQDLLEGWADARPIVWSPNSDDPAMAAASTRAWLGWDTDEQVKSKYTRSSIFKRLRANCEARGITILLDSAHTDYFTGFALPHPTVPLIYVNKDYDLTSVRIFTLVHELGHLLRGEQRICYGEDRREERWCNSFAAEFLMPREAVDEYFRKSELSFDGVGDFYPVKRVANRFKVSWLAAAIRLEELGLGPKGLAVRVERDRPEHKIPPQGGGSGTPRPTLRLEKFGSRFVSSVQEALEEGKLSQLDALRAVELQRHELPILFELSREREG